MIAEGEYFVDQTLSFGPDDSGTPDAPVTFKAAGAVRLTGALAPKACVPLKESDIPDDVKRAVPEPSQGRVLNNHIHHTPHTVIFFYGNDHLIEGNEIHHYTLETGDAGAIYSWLNPEWRGTIIRRNHIHHSGTSGRGGSMEVYLDNCLSGNIIEGNINTGGSSWISGPHGMPRPTT